MSLRSKPPELVDELKIALLLMQAARRVVGLAAWVTKIKMSLRSNPLELVDELKIALLLMQAARRVVGATWVHARRREPLQWWSIS